MASAPPARWSRDQRGQATRCRIRRSAGVVCARQQTWRPPRDHAREAENRPPATPTERQHVLLDARRDRPSRAPDGPRPPAVRSRTVRPARRAWPVQRDGRAMRRPRLLVDAENPLEHAQLVGRQAVVPAPVVPGRLGRCERSGSRRQRRGSRSRNPRCSGTTRRSRRSPRTRGAEHAHDEHRGLVLEQLMQIRIGTRIRDRPCRPAVQRAAKEPRVGRHDVDVRPRLENVRPAPPGTTASTRRRCPGSRCRRPCMLERQVSRRRQATIRLADKTIRESSLGMPFDDRRRPIRRPVVDDERARNPRRSATRTDSIALAMKGSTLYAGMMMLTAGE